MDTIIRFISLAVAIFSIVWAIRMYKKRRWLEVLYMMIPIVLGIALFIL